MVLYYANSDICSSLPVYRITVDVPAVAVKLICFYGNFALSFFRTFTISLLDVWFDSALRRTY